MYRESLGIKTGVLVDHWAILIGNESDVGPFTEMDINCYLYTMKFRGNDSQNILEDFMHNLYFYALGDKVTTNPITGDSDIKLDPPGTRNAYSKVCWIKECPTCQYIEQIVSSLDTNWLDSCFPPPRPIDVYLKSYLEKCGNYDRILMRTWDYLGTNNTPVILYIVYNGDGRVVVTRCKLVIKHGEIDNTQCESQQQTPRRTP